MKTTIDGAGRVVIPKEIRKQAGLAPGTRLEIRYRDGVVEIAPAFAAVRLVREGRFLVAVTEGDIAPLTVEEVERVRQEIYEDRARSILGE